jgi:hypothetical protein
MIKMKKQQLDLANGIDKTAADLKIHDNEFGTVKELIRNVGESVCSMVELEAVTSALE